MEQILHGHFTGQVREQGDTIIRTLVGRGIPQRGHPFREINQRVKTFNTATSRGYRRGL